jgi:hypothetical protein
MNGWMDARMEAGDVLVGLTRRGGEGGVRRYER